MARDRAPDGRARNARPRDELGRPLEFGAEGVERVPEGAVRTAGETLTLAQQLLDAGRPFHAHEVLEDAWKQSPEDERELWRGLAQLAVGLTHRARGNEAGARALLRRGAASMAPFVGRRPHGLDVAALVAAAQRSAEDPTSASLRLLNELRCSDGQPESI